MYVRVAVRQKEEENFTFFIIIVNFWYGGENENGSVAGRTTFSN